ncbi:MAG: InlB B-repeat-containing protein [Eggerthellaceae bacterium]|jgi:uncharacterized repeat protein (TIGR02543 family)
MKLSLRIGNAPSVGTWAAIAMLLAGMIAAAGIPAYADTTLHRNGFGAVPAQKIVFDKLDLSKATVSDAITSVKRKSVKKEGETALRSSLVLHVKKGNAKTISAPFTVRFNNAGYDANGNRVDLLLKCDKLVLKPYQNAGVAKGDYILMRNTEQMNSIGIFAWCVAGQKNQLGIQQDYSVKVLKRGTNTSCGLPLLMYTTDLDTRDLTGKTASYSGPFAESVKLLSGYEQDSYITADSTLKASEGNTRFHGSAIDTNTDKSAVVFSLGAKGGKIRWSGTKCGTNLFKAFSRTITSSAGTGGSIDPNGATSVLWRNNQTFKIDANEHFDIAEVLVDGKSIGPADSYTFKEVTENHRIAASFVPHPYTLSFDLNGQEGTAPEGQNLHYQEKAKKPDEPTAEGFTFEGWYKDPEGNSIWNFETDTMPGADTTLYAKWAPITHTVAFVDPDGNPIDEQKIPDGQDAKDPGAPEISGKTFTGWDKDFTNVKEDLVVTAQYEDAPQSSSSSESSTTESSAESASSSTEGSTSAERSSSQNLKRSSGVGTDASVNSNQHGKDRTGSLNTAGESKSSSGAEDASNAHGSDGSYAKTGNPFIDWWWAFALAGAIGAALVGYGIHSAHRPSHRR